VPVTKPSLELLRQLSDEHVLQALVSTPRMTRAELATHTGISKPTVGDSVRRLVQAGVVVDTGERTTGRGRIGSYFGLANDVGLALVVSIAPQGVTAELVDAHGTVVGTRSAAAGRPARPAQVTAALVKVSRRVQEDALAPTRLAVISAADPVDRQTGRLVRLPDAPFLLGELSPITALAALVDGPITVDNDVNWAARAERAAAPAGGLDDFVYLYLGEGLGCAVVSDGEVRRGHTGLAGEIAHLITTGPRGRALPLTEVFAVLGLRTDASTAIDVPALLAAVHHPGARARRVRAALGQAIGGVASAAVALADPSVIVLGGSWGGHPTVLEAVQAHCAQTARPIPLRSAEVTVDAPLVGARLHAISELRRAIVQYRNRPGRTTISPSG
jgi:predicted NBD/HSP70 family sugar kinase